jgi:hypothetical protein
MIPILKKQAHRRMRQDTDSDGFMEYDPLMMNSGGHAGTCGHRLYQAVSGNVAYQGIIPTTVERTPRAVDSCSGIKFYAIPEFPATERSRYFRPGHSSLALFLHISGPDSCDEYGRRTFPLIPPVSGAGFPGVYSRVKNRRMPVF